MSGNIPENTSRPKPRKPPLRRQTAVLAVRRTFGNFSTDQCLDLAAALTYYAVLASAPAALALVSVLGLVPNGEAAADQIVDIAQQVAPAGTEEILTPLLKNLTQGTNQAGLVLIVGLVGALWSASGYVGAFSRAMNRIYEVQEGRPVWKLRPLLVAVTLLLVVMAAVVALALVLSGTLARTIGEHLGMANTLVTVWDVVKWPVVIALMVGIVAVLYHLTPNVRQPKFRRLSIGALVAILVWILASAGFGFYVSRFSSYSVTYGALAGVIIFLLWLWITNVALLFGAELDAELERGRELERGIAAEENLQLEERDTTAQVKRDRKHAKDVARGREIRLAAANAAAAEARAAEPEEARDQGHAGG